MQAPSAVGFTTRQRLMMFWQHKRTLVVCVASVVLAGILIVVLFTVAEVKTFYAKFSGQNQQPTQVTNVYTLSSSIDGLVNPNKTINGTAGAEMNTTLFGNNTINSTVTANQASTNTSMLNTTQTNSTTTVPNPSTNQTVAEPSSVNKTQNTSKTNSTDIKKHRHHQFLHKQAFRNIKQHFFSYRQYR